MNFKKFLPGNRRGNHGHRRALHLEQGAPCSPIGCAGLRPVQPSLCLFCFLCRMGDRPSSGIWRFTGPRVQLFSVPEQLTEGGLGTAVGLSAEWEIESSSGSVAGKQKRRGLWRTSAIIPLIVIMWPCPGSFLHGAAEGQTGVSSIRTLVFVP